MAIEITEILLGLLLGEHFYLLEMSIHCTALSIFLYILNISSLKRSPGNGVEAGEGNAFRMKCFYCFLF